MHSSLRLLTRRTLSSALTAAAALLSLPASAQTTSGVGIGTTAPDASALLDLTSVTKGLLAPRMTASERTAIQSPAPGLLVYQLDGVQLGFWYYSGSVWTYLNPAPAGDNLGSHTATQNLNLADKLLVGNGGTSGLSISGTGNVGAGIGSAANRLDVASATRSGTHATGRPLYVTGNIDEAANGIEFRHSNASQGIGFGYNTIYATGFLANQHLNLLPRGTGGVGVGTTTPAASALVDISSTTKGFLPPRLTQSQREAIASPAAGLLIFNATTRRLEFFDGTMWRDPLPANEDGLQVVQFGATNAVQTFTVPAGITSMQVDMTGAAGQSSLGSLGSGVGGPGGQGARLQATLTVTPGQVLNVYVGSSSFNGGGSGYSGGGAGGGATDIRLGGTDLANRVLVAGGGGGAGGDYYSGWRSPAGGCGGSPIGCAGGSYNSGVGGGGGTQSQGGAGPAAGSGSLGQGGAGRAFDWQYYPGGGGGGYYGGGGGYISGAGGGGSSYADAAVASNVTFGTGTTASVTLRFTRVPTPVVGLDNATLPVAEGSVLFGSGNKLAGNASQLYWDNAGTRLGIGTGSPQAKLHVAGAARIDGLGGSGARMVTTDNSGNLSTQTLPTDAQTLTLSGQQLTISGGNAVTLPNGADNLGNHAATQNLVLGDNAIRLRSATDANQQLRFDATVQGPQLMGYQGGELGYNQGTYTPVLRWTNGGNVGIGTGATAPAARLEVAGGEVRLPGGGGGGGPNTHFNFSGDGKNYLRGTTVLADAGGNVGIGTASPAQKLDVAGNANVSGNLTAGGSVSGSSLTTSGNATVSGLLGFGSSTRQMLNLWNTAYGIGIQDGTQYFRSGDAFAWYSGGAHNDAQLNAGGGTQQMMLKNGYLGIGAGFTTTALPNAPLEIRQASPFMVLHAPGNSWMHLGLDAADNYKFKIGEGGAFSGSASGPNWLTISGGKVGIGTTSPAVKLDVQGSSGGLGQYTYSYLNYGGVGHNYTATPTDISIRASGRIVGAEFNATSDRRLKTVIGLSDRAADLALLNRIRITDYTMRDRVQYGERQFKKVIAQEVEAVFPQAVSQHTGFLPDVYAVATKAEVQADSLLRLTLPAALPTAAKAGQRVRLIGPGGEVTATVKAAAGNTLLVRGVRQLAGQQVFVFGLEHPDVRTVDYEALSMLNVSATQELARKVQALENRNARLQQQVSKLEAAATTQAQTAQQLQQQAAQTAELAQRLKTLEALLGARAEAR